MKKITVLMVLASLCFFQKALAWATPSLSSPANGATSQLVGVTLDWNAVSSSAGYQIQVDISPSFNSPSLATANKAYINTSSSNSDTQHSLPLRFGQVYYWRVRAYITNDTSAWTSTWNFTTYNYVSLNTPTNGATSQFTGLYLDWYAHTGVDFYDIEVDTLPTFNSLAKRTASTNYINTSSTNLDTESYFENLYFGKTYYWRVRARNAVDTSEWNVRNFTTYNYVSLNTPTNGATSQFTGLYLDWYAHTGVDFYDIEVDTLPTFNTLAKRTASTNYINSSSTNLDTESYFENLYFGKTYYWRVRARNAVDTSEWNVRNFTTYNYVSLNTPTNGATSQFTGLYLDWYAHTGVDFYDVEVDTLPTFNSLAKRTASTNYINSSSTNLDTESYFENLYFGKTYYWRVRARNAVDTSEWNVRNFTTYNYVSLNTPTNGATSQFAGLYLDWYAHTGVDFYDIEVDTLPTFNSLAKRTASTNYINTSSTNLDTESYFENLYFGKTYYWRVRARNAVDTSEWNVRNFTTYNYVSLNTPTNGATSQFTGLYLDWYAHTGVDFYDVEVDTLPTFNTLAKRTASTNYINTSSTNLDTESYFENLYFGKTYYWRVRARNAVDTSEWNVRNFTTYNYVSLNTPTNGATSQFTGLYLDWYAHTGVDFYDIEVDTLPTFNTLAKRTASTNYINSSSTNLDTESYFENLYFGKTYYWRVRARNAVDTSEWNVRNFTTYNTVSLNTPANATLNVSAAGTALDWYSHVGVNSYEMQLDKSNAFNSSALVSINKTYINSSSSNNDTYHSTGALSANTYYFWRVRAINDVDTSEWATRYFSTGNAVVVYPNAPVLVSPANNSTGQPATVNLVWSSATNANTYEYQYAMNPSFNGALGGTTNNTSVTISGLGSGVFYWRVRGIDVNGLLYSSWSNVWNFSTTCNLAAPTVSNQSICSGNSILLTASGGTSYNWYDAATGGNLLASASTYSTPILTQTDTFYVSSLNGSCESNVAPLIVNITPSVTPSINILANNNAICAGTLVTFSATATNGGTTPAYQWKINNVNVGTNSNTFSASTLNNNDIITCQFNSNATCATATSVNSNSITMSVSPQVNPSISISASATTICTGQSVTFSSNISNGGANPAYQWKVNNVNVGTNATYSATNLNNNDIVVCVLTSDANCLLSNNPTSNAITMNVASSFTPSVAITANSTNLCAGQSATFTATPTNGGTSPVYQWQVNGANVGGNSATLNANSLNNNDIISCTLSSNANCVSNPTANSNSITVTVNPSVTPTISINATTLSACSGQNISFSANGTNTGTSPIYQWKVNNVNVGTNSPTFSTSTLNNFDVITCEMQSSITCVTSSNVSSNSLTVSITPSVTPNISINASATTICAGQNATFSSNINNGGANPAYQWQVNGANLGTNSSSFAYSPANGDVVSCILTSDALCATSSTANSNLVSLVVNNALTPSLSISATTTAICSGDLVTFTASATNGGNSPIYQWQKNGTGVGANSSFYSSTTLANNDIITCQVTSNANCLTTPNATSNSITMSVNQSATPQVSITVNDNSICEGETATFIANPTNGGGFPILDWYVNGFPTGSTGATYSTNALFDGDIVDCILTTSLSSCITNPTATSNAISMTVSIAPFTPFISQSLNTLMSSATSGNQWYLNNNLISGATSTTYNATQSGNYSVCTTNISGCTVCSFPYTFVYVSNELPNTYQIETYPNPFAEKIVLSFSENMPMENTQVFVYDAIGKCVYHSENIHSQQFIETKDWVDGIYHLLIQSPKGNKALKMQKQGL